MAMRKRWWIWLLGTIAGLIILAVVLAFFIDEPLRRYVEQQMNSRLKGYTVRIGRLDLHPLSFSVDLYEVAIVQDANPDPPIVHVADFNASVHWRALLSGRVVSDVVVDRPKVHINLKQIRDEAADEVPVQERGWQEAVQAVMLLRLNELWINNGEVTYIDEGSSPPLQLSQLQFRAENIRNVRSDMGVYPSPLSLDGIIFDAGKLSLKGHADFLAVPHVALNAQLALENIQLNPVKPIAARHNVDLRAGIVSATGTIEYTPTIKVAHLESATIQGLQMDYVHTAQATAAQQQAVQQVREKAQQVKNAPDILTRADQVSIVKSTIGVVNRMAQPNYRVFLSAIEADLTNFSNQLTQGIAAATLTGKFMGSGQTVVGATFRPETKGPDFTLAGSIENTEMEAMNNLLRAHGKFDVVHGIFSVYCELRVKNGMIGGYIKPLFREMDVYDPIQDREKHLFQKLYEAVIGGVSEVLENMPRDEVATKADISGRLENPQASTWQVLLNLIRNAFFESLLPGFEGEIGRSAR
jgi:hypothetical protein